jgi:hypothetical protein
VDWRVEALILSAPPTRRLPGLVEVQYRGVRQEYRRFADATAAGIVWCPYYGSFIRPKTEIHFTRARVAAIRHAMSDFQTLVRIVTKCRSKVQTGASSLRISRASRASTGPSRSFRSPFVATPSRSRF